MIHITAAALTVKTVGPVLARAAAKRLAQLFVAGILSEVEREVRRKIESGEARNRMESFRMVVEDYKRWFDERPGHGPAAAVV